MKALIVVDLQNDFVPGGALAVPDGDTVIKVANRMMTCFDCVVATQDWHPRDHGSFAASHPGKSPGDIIELDGLEQVLWPVHCVQNTHGAAFVPGFDTGAVEKVFRKGTDPAIDSYSGFFDNGHRKDTGLGDYLKDRGADEVYVLGLATDYCVKYTVFDSRMLGFATYLIIDGCRGVNLNPGDDDLAVEDMKKAGVKIVASDMVCG